LKKAQGYLRLMRPANILTSVADVLGGVAVSGILANYFTESNLLSIALLCLSSACLYGGGVVFNDVFDAGLDKTERPERAIPSGVVTVREAILLGGTLLVAAIGFALACDYISGILALSIAVFALVYNKWGKHHPFLGPLNMGICRGLNLLLGISILTIALAQWYLLAIIPVIYIYSITMISRGEVHGSNRSNLYAAVFLYLVVIASVLAISLHKGQVWLTLLFLTLFAWMIFAPLLKAIQDPVGRNIGKAVKAGVISLIVLNAAWAAAFDSLFLAVVIICFLPFSVYLGKMFAVT
jgi:4-hydroxybenzoate polyprenyltransferase